jgi:hypothetical protein
MNLMTFWPGNASQSRWKIEFNFRKEAHEFCFAAASRRNARKFEQSLCPTPKIIKFVKILPIDSFQHPLGPIK